MTPPTLTGRCSTCSAPLVWAGSDRLVCPKPNCTGHQPLHAPTGGNP